ncbi:SDR family NAD(P)-dependent oxidoreductase, partial [Streptomyces sp. 150FB]|uniref:SDR family NAD(P)-dependent oxidoreductase n=1 Tax=Streptomyces sp. 150FB TaxID=1576605 RepID=UPI0005894CB2
YWYENLRRTVEFEPTVRELAGDGFTAFVECSAHPVLAMGVQGVLDAAVEAPTVVVGSLRRGEGGAGRFLMSLAEAHVQGVDVDWRRVFGQGRRVVDLPTYAFQRSRYWLDAKAPASAAADSVDAQFWRVVEGKDMSALADTLAVERGALEEVLPALNEWRRREALRSDLDSLRYEVSWAPLTEPAAASALSGTWLVVAAEGDISVPAVAEALRRNGADVAIASLPVERPERWAVAEAVRTVLPENGPTGVLSLLSTDDRPYSGHPALTSGFATGAVLLQSLADLGVTAPLWSLTTSAVAVDGAEPLDHPLQAEAWGLGIVASLDTPTTWGGLVDLPAESDAAIYDRLCGVLVRGDGEDQVAIRRSGVFGRRLVRARAGGAPTGGSWRPRGTVLITGGTGALGGHVARWLAARGAERLVLTSRRGEEAPGAGELVAELAALGTRATVVACDLADRTAVEKLLVEIRADGDLTGVVHTAGVTGPACPLTDLTLDELGEALAAKAGGARHLDELLADHPLDAFVLFSSAAGIWGNAGQSAYVAGNAYLDALARHRRSRGLPATCVSWGAWEGGGMVDAAEAARLERNGVLRMAPEQAIDSLQRILDDNAVAQVVARVDWERFAELYTLSRPRPLLAELSEARAAAKPVAAVTDTGSPAVRLLALGEDERRRELLRLVRERAAGTLGHATPDAVRASRPFRELGVDSLTAVDLRNKLNAVTGLRIPVTAVFDHPTPAALASYLNAELTLRAVGAPTDGAPETVPLTAVERLEVDLGTVAGDERVRREVVDRLRGVLRHWEAGTAEDLEAISDDEMFDLIDRELDGA